jgi:5-aminolevulinate synthase
MLFKGWVELISGSLSKLKQTEQYRQFAVLDPDGQEFPYTKYKTAEEGNSTTRVITWCSNDYLGMTRNSRLIAVAQEIATKYGVGSGGSRNIAGNTILHQRLESVLAELHHTERALVCTSAYVANEALFTTLGALDCVFLSDRLNHASIIQGIKSSGRPKLIFDHNNVAALQSALEMVPSNCLPIIVVESVYSMDGDVAPLFDISRVATDRGALLIVDEVNGVGLYGPRGAGIVEELGLQEHVDIVVGTFGKAFGVAGGYIAGSDHLIDFIRSFSSHFIFTTSLPVLILGCALESVHFVSTNTPLREQHRKRCDGLELR